MNKNSDRACRLGQLLQFGASASPDATPYSVAACAESFNCSVVALRRELGRLERGGVIRFDGSGSDRFTEVSLSKG